MRDREAVDLDAEPAISDRGSVRIIVTRESIARIELESGDHASGVPEITLDERE
jgi:hypothetical protein